MPEKQRIERTRRDEGQGKAASTLSTRDDIEPEAGERARLRTDFDRNDLNHDGHLTLGEFIRFMRSVDEDMTAEECEFGFDEIDSNRDGAIEFEEFVAWSQGRD